MAEGRCTYPSIGIVDRMGLVEFTRVLREDIQFTAENGPCFSVDCVSVADGVHIRSSFVDGGVDHEACGIER